jgi:hypothetical protein
MTCAEKSHLDPLIFTEPSSQRVAIQDCHAGFSGLLVDLEGSNLTVAEEVEAAEIRAGLECSPNIVR